ncbi:MAG TPA: glycosyltransferase 87 family protein [Ktedonobacterales bacterium]
MNTATDRPKKPQIHPARRRPALARAGDLARRFLSAVEARPGLASGMMLGVWTATRLALLIGVIFGARYADPQFYDYAGKLAVGLWPYRDVPVEYPPVAIALLLAPALPLLLFTGIAPRPDPAFLHITHLPAPDPVRYGAYGVSFAIEMLLVDAITLWLVTRSARRLAPRGGELVAAGAGLAYAVLTFLAGGILQKFDVAVGALLLGAVLALVERRRGLAWALLALATLTKGFPVLAAPVFLLYELELTGERDVRRAIRAALTPILRGVAWLVGVIGAATLGVMLFASWASVLHTVTYHTGRGAEIESLYAAFALALSWIPGFAAQTAFHPSDLSRVVNSPLLPAGRLESTASVALALALALVYLALWIGWRARVRAGSRGPASDKALRARGGLALGVTLTALAFILCFRALPTHYLLDFVPLAPALWLGTRRRTAVWLGGLVGVGVMGQILVNPGVWRALVALNPLAVVALEARNLAWLVAAGALLVAAWRGMLPGRRVERAEKHSGAGAGQQSTPWRRLLASAPPIPGFTPRSEDVFAHLFAQISPRIALLSAGIISLICYAGLVAAFPLPVYYNHPHTSAESSQINDMGAITGYSPLAATSFVVVILLLFGAQFVALLAASRGQRDDNARQRRLTALLIYGAPVIFMLVMIWMHPVTTTDLYGYIARGYLSVHFHGNPMTTAASRLPGGYAVDRPASPYGPGWLMIAALFSWMSGENLLLNMLLFKALAGLCVLIALALVDYLARRRYPERRWRIAVLFGWSPLLFFESVGNGHNDIVMAVCVLAAFALMLRGRAQSAFAFLALGAIIKYVSAFFMPLWLVYELRQRALTAPLAGREKVPMGFMARLGWLRRMVAWLIHELDVWAAARIIVTAFVIGATIAVAAYAPYWDGLQTFTGLGQQLRPLYYNGSIVQFITAPLELFVQPSHYAALDKTVRLVFYALFVIYATIQAQRLWILGAQAEIQDVITAAAKVTFASLVLITFWFQPWYIVWLLPLAALARESYVRRQGTLISIGALLTYAVSNFLLVGTPGIGRDLFVQFFEALLTFAPLLLLRAAPYEEGWVSIVRRYWSMFAETFTRRPVFWQRVMLALAMIVAALLRLLRLGNLSLDLSGGSADVNALKQISGDLRVFLADPQGLVGPFAAMEGALVRIFGPTPLAALLPSALIGTLTVLAIYELTIEILRQTGRHEQFGVALLAALLTATSSWHVSLSRSGTEVVLLPLLLSAALWALLRGFHLAERPPATARPHGWLRSDGARLYGLYIFAGLATGLACDLAPGLWITPVLMVGFLLAWRWRRPALFTRIRGLLVALGVSATLACLPVLWGFISQIIGFAVGSPAFARSSVPAAQIPSPLTATFWARVAVNAVDVLKLLVTQDYSAGYPAVGGAPIIPPYLGAFFYLGLVIIAFRLARTRDMTSLALALLLALPLVATVTVSAPVSIIEAASVLPATCIVPAMAMYEIAAWVGRLPIVLDRLNGVRVFTTPDQIGRVALFLFLSISALRTFYWYFEATLPASPTNTYTPSAIALGPSLALARGALSLLGHIIGFHAP